MAVIDIQDESLTKERDEIETFRSGIESRINSIEAQVTTLKEVWQDEKSANYLNQINNQITDLNKANNDAKNATDTYFEEIVRQVKIYAGE